MKRLFQIAALMVVTLLTTEPILAAYPCSMDRHLTGQCARCCSEAMSHMPPASQKGTSCPMHFGLKASSCDSNCCQHNLPKPTLQWASILPSKALKALTFVALPSFVAAPQPSLLVHPPQPPETSTPPRFILNQVFRI